MNPFSKLLPSYITIDEQHGEGTILSFTASIAVHRKHTKKDLFVVQGVATAILFTDWDKVKTKPDVLKEYAKNILKSLDGTAKQGWYEEEKLVGDDYTNIKRYYNQWVWYDRKNNKVVGDVQVIHSTLGEEKLS